MCHFYGNQRSYFSIILFFAFLDELVTIKATPIIIMLVAINVRVEIGSLRITHPRNTAITGTIYANELAMDWDSA